MFATVPWDTSTTGRSPSSSSHQSGSGASACEGGNAGPKKTQAVAEAYLRFLYSPQGQAIAAKNHYRPATPEAANAQAAGQFQKLDLVTIDKDFGGWAKAQPEHFGDGGTFDQLYGKK